MKSLLPLLLLSWSAFAAESPRTWTDAKGRKVEGTLMEKTETSATVMLKSAKRVTLKLADLSESDQEYVAKAAVFPSVVMVAKTVTVESNEAETKLDARQVDVSVTKMHGRKYEATIIWLGARGSKVVAYQKETVAVPEDGKLSFSVTYRRDKEAGRDYKGYVVGLREDGNAVWAAKSASQKPFERFLDESK